MEKYFFKTIFNPNKNINIKLNNSPSLSENLIPNNEEIKFPQKQSIGAINILSNYYSKEEKNDNILNNFIEKIGQLNKEFCINSEKFISAKSSFDKLNDDLFMNLFKQIDYYVEEIQRLNKRIVTIDNKDYKQIIKKLNKEISENKIKIKNYEMKINQKTINEENLKKEIEYYKRRLIFYKNKIKINLISRNTNNIKKNKSLNKRINRNKIYDLCYNNINSPILCFTKRGSKNNNSLMENLKQLSKNNYISPRVNHEEINNKIENNISCLSPYNDSSNSKRKDISKRSFFLNLKNNSNNNEIKPKKKLISVNVGNKFKGIFYDGENERNSQKKLIKINKICNSEGSIILSLKKKDKNGQNINIPKSNEKNIDNDFDIDSNLNLNKNRIELSPKKYIEEHLNILSNKKKHNRSEIISSKFYSFINNKKKKKEFEEMKENEKNNLNTNFNLSRNNSSIKENYYNRTLYQKNKKYKIFKSYTNQKLKDTKKLFDLKPKKLKNILLSSNSKTNFIDYSNKYNINNINNDKNDYEITKSQLSKVNQEDTIEISKKLLSSISKKENKINITKNREKLRQNLFNINTNGNNENNVNKENNINNENNSINKCAKSQNISYIDNNNNTNISNNFSNIKNKIIFNYNTNGMNIKKTKTIINVNKKKYQKDLNNKKEKELKKILKEINDDYNNDIELLNSQENQIKFLLNLIDLNEE